MTSFRDRRVRTDERPLLGVAVVWVIAAALLIAMSWNNIVGGQQPDPDDFLRLVQVRDLLNGQGWFDLHQYRVGSNGGMLMHWSRIVDVPIALIILALTPFIGAHGAELAAMIVTPLAIMGLCMAMCGMLAWRLFNREVAVLACMCFIISPMVMMQMQPLRINHHGYQILAVITALWSISWRNPWRGGAAAGCAMAVGLMISVELLPMVAAFAVVLLLRWLRDSRERQGLAGYMQALVGALVVLFVATRGVGDLAAYCDVVAPTHLGFFLIAAIGTTLLARIPQLAVPQLLLGFAVTGGIAAGLFALSAPECVGNPFGTLDPVVYKHWYQNVGEGQSIWYYDWGFVVGALAQPLIGLVAAVALVGRSAYWLRRWWADYAVLLALAIVAGALTTRSMAFAGAIAAIPLGWLVATLIDRWSRSRSVTRKIVLPIAILVILIPMGLTSMAAQAMNEPEEKASAASAMASTGGTCDYAQSLPALDRLPRGKILGFIDLGPNILRDTKHSIVASSHHRANLDIRDVIVAFSSNPDIAKAIVNRHRADYVALCTDLPETRLWADIQKGDAALIDKLLAGHEPDWLEPIPSATSDSFKIWRVRRQ